MFTSQESGLPLLSVAVLQSNTNQGEKEILSPCLTRGCRKCLGRNTKRGKRICASCTVSSSVETSYISRDDRFAVVANCYGDEAVAPPFVRFTELLSSSFHCSVLRVLKIKSSPRYPGCWTYQAMKMRNTFFRGGSAMRPRESASFCR